MSANPANLIRILSFNQVTGSLIFEPPIAVNQYNISDVEIGFGTYLNGRGEISNTLIGRYCSIASGCKICLSNHRLDCFSTHPIYAGIDDHSSGLQGMEEYDRLLHQIAGDEDQIPSQSRRPTQVSIGNDVWIGANCILLAGVQVGNGSVVGAGSVVTKSVPPYTIVAGNPAKVIRHRFDKSVVYPLEILKWWNLDIFTTRPIKEPRAIPRLVCDFLTHVECLVSTGQASYIDNLPKFKIKR